jgi:NADH:ubiquinone oxidoreductase subunit F (NADH-binding)
MTPRVTAFPTDDLDEHQRRFGPPSWRGGKRRLIPALAEAGLTGRGGAGFPTWRKLTAVADGRGRPVVVANGAESEPVSGKDRALLARAPHLVLDGLQLAAEAVGASRAYAYVPAGAVGPVEAALHRRRRAGRDRFDVTVIEAPDAFVAGEETAVVSRVEGRAALPRDTPVRVRGVRGAPTLVQNVETLAHLALIARRGAEWFRTAGTVAEPGTFLATITGAVATPGVYEAAYGETLGDLLDRAGGAVGALRAVLVGGYHGAWVPPVRGLPVSRAGLAGYGAGPGAGVIVALPASACGLVESARIAGYLAGQSARQCGPCLNGLPRLADSLGRLARCETGPGVRAEVERLAGLVNGRGACRHPDGVSRFVRSSMHTFAAEVEAHLGGRCGV